MFIGKLCHYLYTCLFGDPNKYEKIPDAEKTTQIAQKIFSPQSSQILQSLPKAEVLPIRKNLEHTYLVAVRNKLQNLSSENYRTKAPNILKEFKKNIKELRIEHLSSGLESALDELIQNFNEASSRKSYMEDRSQSQLAPFLRKLSTQITAKQTNELAIQFINEQESDDKRPSKHLPISQAEYDLRVFDEITSLSASPNETLNKQPNRLKLVTALVQEISAAKEEISKKTDPSRLNLKREAFEVSREQFSKILSDKSEFNILQVTNQSKLLKTNMERFDLTKEFPKIISILKILIPKQFSDESFQTPRDSKDNETHEA